jgi:hypothetical protein
MYNCFHAADILLPKKLSMKKWACVACDQFSSEPEYWARVADFVGEAPSTYHMIYPEALLRQGDTQARLQSIHAAMEEYLSQNLFETHRRSFIYLERTMLDGSLRRGLMGQIDLEAYDFTPGSGAKIRATEGTVQERIPPRMKLLEGAALEFPHVLLLCDDDKDAILQTAATVHGEEVYDFDLMEGGGHITGWSVSGLGVAVVNAAITEYIAAMGQRQGTEHPMAFAVGDGNHSLASAKACWEKLKPTLSPEEQQTHPARFALVELENIHDPAITFEPIHRVVRQVDPAQLMTALRGIAVPEGYPITCLWQGKEETVYLDKNASPLAVAILQPFLDQYVAAHGGSMDYIHGADVVRSLSQQPETLGLILPGMEKSALFPGVLQGGVLPRKTFSMGAAREKRYYLEGKKRR